MTQAQKKIYTYGLVLLAGIFSFHTSLAKNDPPYISLLQGDSIKAGKMISVQDTVFFNPLLKPTILRTNSVSNIISLRINEYSNIVLPDSFTVAVKIRLIYTNKNNLTDSISEKTLSIDYNKLRSYKSRDIYYLKDGYQMQVKVLEVTVSYATPEKILPVLELENKLQIDRDYVMNIITGDQMNCSSNAIRQVNKDISTIDDFGELKISWLPNRTVDSYDVEWTYIDQSALSNGNYNDSSGQLSPYLVFKNNASRVNTTIDTFMIPLLYDGEGSLFYRVRGVQEDPGGELITTLWSSEFVSEGGLGRYDYTGHERKLNWQATTSFAEEARRKSVVQYFDGSLRNRQTVTRDNNTRTTVVAETFYDKQGRPVIQVLPAPTLSKLISYTPGFNTANMNGREYDKGIYDTLIIASDYCDKGADSMSVSNGSSQYYSANNPLKNEAFHQFIPNAFGYAFTETQYSQDNTGRIDKQGGVGKDFGLGSGHETKYYYGTPEQTDLDALFGTEAGEASHYQKNMVRDANGQYSVSYIDMHGRTIATALAGDSARGMRRLNSYRDSLQTEELLNLTNNVINGNSIQSTKSLLVTMAGTHTFNYSLGAESLTLQDCQQRNICYDCLYDLTITITGDCNNQLFGGASVIVKKSNFKLFKIDTTCNLAIPVDTSFTRWLEPGSYNITKELSISKEGMQYYRDSLYLLHNSCKSYDEILAEQKEIVRNGMNCDNTPETQYEYQSYRTDMLMDLYPLIGQYADTAVSGGCYSIFNKNGAGGAYQRSDLVYKDEDGNPALVMNSAGILVSPQQLTKEEFIQNFQNSWANSLLPLHPEYRLLIKYESDSVSLKWDEDFSNTETYAQAKAKGYLNPTGNTTRLPASGFANITSDPLYSLYTESATAKNAIEDSLFNFKKIDGVNVSLWAFATAISKCPDADTIDRACVLQCNQPGNAFNETGLCEGDLDMSWKFFRSQYLDYKHDWILTYIRSTQGNPIIDTPCIRNFTNSQELLRLEGFNQTIQDSVTIHQQANQFFDDNCKAFASRWWDQLKIPCNYFSANDSAIIISYLINVCREGADIDHPFGSNTVKPGSTYRFKSFEDVIKFYNDSTGHVTDINCNSYLLDKPLPYEQSVPLVRKPLFGKPDNCECENINGYYNQFLAKATQYGSFSNFMLQKYNTNISQGALNSLQNLCNNTINCKYISKPIYLPTIFQCLVSAPCVPCTTVKQLYDSFLVKFPGKFPLKEEPDTIQQKINAVFVSYMNRYLGFSKSNLEYLSFMDSCRNYSSEEYDSKDDTLKIPISGVSKPAGISCEKLITTYKTFLADFPDPATGAVVKVFVPGESMRSVNPLFNQPDQLNEDVNSMAALPDSIQQSARIMTILDSSKTKNSSRAMTLSAMTSGTFVDSLLQCKQLFEWYFNNNLGIGGYTYENFTDWLVNSCGYKIYQLPCSDSVFVSCDTLQRVKSLFDQKYPANLGDTITATMQVPVNKVTHIVQRFSYNGTFFDEYSQVSGGSLDALTWTNFSGGFWWHSVRDNIGFDFRALPQNATINNASLNLYAKRDPVEYYTCCGAHYRHNTDSVYGIIEKLNDRVIPGVTLWSTLPSTDVTNRLILNPVSISNSEGSGDDLFSDEDYLNQTCIQLTRNLHSEAWQNRNYGLLFKQSKENTGVYKAYTFWGITSATPVNKLPNLSVNYTTSRCDLFTSFVNTQLGTHLTTGGVQKLFANKCGQTVTPCGTTSPQSNPLNGPLLCGKTEAMDEPFVFIEDDPCADSTTFAIITAMERYRIYKDSLAVAFEEAYMQKCLNAVNLESFTVEHPVSEYHYTLYYYDLAGNLIKTVPPEGVHPDRDPQWLQQVKQKRNNTEKLVPEHTLVTVYRYNSLNQVVTQQSPDGGYSEFWYDRLGRLAVSRNAKQKAENKYSYTLYDALGRITEVGQKQQTEAMTTTIARDPVQLGNWLNTVYLNANASTCLAEQVTATIYDIPDVTTGLSTLIPVTQKSYTLRNRVSYTRTYDYLFASTPGDPVYSGYDYSTSYCYDIHGNVDTLFQQYRTGLMAAHGDNRFKIMAYKYDLISGKVNQVHYQPGLSDQLYHRYEYDAENRITDVYVSDNKLLIGDVNLEEHDAHYDYYKHGPLARSVIGQQQVQGLDYAYTLQGWLKGVNTDSTLDNTNVGRDAFNLSLHYFNGDYHPIGSSTIPIVNAAGNTAFKNLYNGNIGAMAVNIKQLGQPLVYNYGYDQLNRLTAMDAYKGWNGVSTFAPDKINDYQERITYDGNGNIMTYKRNGDAARQSMDDMAYSYKANTNQLDKVSDAASDAAAGDYDKYNDIKQGQQNGNYTYDAIGNLIKDNDEKIIDIQWTVYGKIQSITKTAIAPGDVKSIFYTYDAGGNRISKVVEKKDTDARDYTWYVRDASGNVMAVYTYSGATLSDGILNLSEQHLYGSSRLGIWNRNVNMGLPPDNGTVVTLLGPTFNGSFERGNKFFELSNHLRNVLATVSDKKIGHTTNGTTIDYSEANVVTANDYYPGGMDMPGRSYSIANTNYRYGFNGKEKDNKDGVVQYDYGFRIYDPRLVRFKSIDPLSKSYPWNSPYSYAEGDLIRSIDLDGLEKLIIHEIYDKYGRRNFTELSGIRDVDTKAAIDLNMMSKMGVKLAKEDVYIIRHRKQLNGPIFFEGNGGSLSNRNVSDIAKAPTVQGEEDLSMPEGTMRQSEATSRGRFYFSPFINNEKNEFFTSQFNQTNSQPIIKTNKLSADFVSGTLVNGNPGSSFGLNATKTTNTISNNIDGYISDFKKNNGVNVAVVEQITITISNNDNRGQWNAIQKNLKQKYNANVVINVDANIQSKDSGSSSMGRAAGSYGSVDYKVSGVTNGNLDRAEPGAR